MDERETVSGRPDPADRHAGTRRRGEVLEDAILLAASEELSETGYSHLTMEKVAARAGTNKAVLYRRWANKSDLVIAALHRYLPKFKNEIPNTGSLRDDLYAFLRGLTDPIRLIGAQTIRGLMLEPHIWRNIVSSMPQIIERRPESKLTAAMTEIMKNAELRGEVRLERLTPRIISLPLDLLQFEIFTRQELTDTTITEIVDDIFMPLIHAAQ
jgi:AcrR family transcriptional regulator